MEKATAQHPNASLTPRGRAGMVKLVTDQGWPVAAAAERCQVDPKGCVNGGTVTWRKARKGCGIGRRGRGGRLPGRRNRPPPRCGACGWGTGVGRPGSADGPGWRLRRFIG